MPRFDFSKGAFLEGKIRRAEERIRLGIPERVITPDRTIGFNWYDEDARTARQLGDVDSFRELTDQKLIGEPT